MHLGPVPDQWLDEYPILVFEETITAFADWPGHGKTDYQGGLFAQRIKYIQKIHLVWACIGQVYSLFNAHLVSLIQMVCYLHSKLQDTTYLSFM